MVLQTLGIVALAIVLVIGLAIFAAFTTEIVFNYGGIHWFGIIISILGGIGIALLLIKIIERT